MLSKYRELSPAIQEAQMQQLQFNQTMEKLQPVVGEISAGLSNAITGLIDGTKSVEEAFAEMFSNIAQSFLKMATDMLAQQAVLGILKAFGGGPAPTPGGGPLSGWSGGGYTGNAPRSGGVDGEGGFVTVLHPQETVIDHHMNGGVQGAYDEARSAMKTTTQVVQTKTQDKKEEQTYAALQQSATQDVNVRYESTVINNETYVTEQQFQKGMNVGIKQARAQTLKQLRNRPAVRGKAGIS